MSRQKLVEMIWYHKERTQEELVPPLGFDISSLKKIVQDDLYPCYFAAFQAGDSQLFFRQSEEEWRDFFDTLGFDQAQDEPGTVMLLKAGQIVGFTLVVPYGETNCHISCMCVHPNFQRQGLGSFMLNHAKVKAISQGYKSITLWTEPKMGAFRLYHQHGFKITEEKEL